MKDLIPKNPIKFGLFVSKPFKFWAFLAVFFVLVGTAVDRLTYLIYKNLADTIATTPLDINALWFWAALYPVLNFVGSLIWRSSGFSGMRWFTSFRSHGYKVLYEYLSLHSKDYFNNRFAGALVNKIGNAVDGAETLFERMLWNFTPLLLGFVWYAVILSWSDIRLGLIVIFWSIFILTLNFFLARKMQPYSYKNAMARSTLKGRIVDSLSNISLVHEYAYLEGEHGYIGSYISKMHDIGLKRWIVSEWVLVTNGILIFFFMLAMVGFSVHLFTIGVVTIGTIVMVIAIVGDIGRHLFFIGQEMRDAAGSYGEIKEGLEEILTEHVITNSPNATELKVKKGEIELSKVDFEYENTKVFKNLSMHIPAGQKVGFVGRSGAGKTTFASLLLRHFDTQGGEITIDGQEIKEVTLESLRRSIAFVPQDTSLFHRTILENIRYSNPEATEAQVKKAAKLAQAHDFIEKLPKGYETLVGERGVKLSGGQRQRIAIARAFLKNAPILILDEATSSLDSESEGVIQEALSELMKGRTVIAIAHRLSTLKSMDRIVLIESGKIAEDGSPEKLLKKAQGGFKKMWEHQVKGFIIDEV